MDRRWKEALLAWSLVNLLFFRRWAQVLPGGHDYFLAGPRPPVEYLALIVLILVISLAAWGVLVAARRSRRAWPMATVRAAFVVAALVGVRAVLVEGWVLLGRPEFALWVELLPVLAVVAALVWLQVRRPGWHRKAVPVAVSAMMLFVPLVPIMNAQGLYHAVAVDAAADRFVPLMAPMNGDHAIGGRVVWIILDEMDQRLTFEERPEGYELPELERLMQESLYATHAYAPNAATLRSIPSMTTGRFVEEARPHAIDGLSLRFVDEDADVEWMDADTLFADARGAGADVGIVGTYHPYCRVFADDVSHCTFVSHYRASNASFGEHLTAHLSGLTRALPTATVQDLFWSASGFKEGVSLGRQEREIEKYGRMVPAAVTAAARADLDLVFIHLNVPHPTGMRGAGRGYYDAATGEMATGSASTYFDNLVLADRTLGQIRHAMEESGVWDDTTVIVTSDHGYRAGIWRESTATEPFGDLLLRPTDHRVVFLFKPTGPPTDGSRYDAPFNLVLMRPLVADALAGGVTSAPDAAVWLDAHRTVGPAPHYVVR